MNRPVDEPIPTVLVVDDSDALRYLLCQALQLQGYHAVQAGNGQEALNLCQNALPDLVLMDVQMPVMDGLTACAALRQLPACKAVPVLLMTANAPEPCLIASIRAAGANDYMFKPFELRALYERVKRLCAVKTA